MGKVKELEQHLDEINILLNQRKIVDMKTVDIICDFFNDYKLKDVVTVYNDKITEQNLDKVKNVLEALTYINTTSKITQELEKTQENENVEESVVDFLKSKYNTDDVTEIDSFKSYVDLCSDLTEGLLSRGQKSYKFNFLPSAMRRIGNNKALTKEEVESMFISFRQKLYHYFPGFRSKTNTETKAFAQHFGLPTYLLDFTESHLTSLLFAVEDYNDDETDSIVFFVDAKKVNGLTSGKEILIDCSENENSTKIDSLMDSNFIFVKSDDIHSRLHMQKGCFLSFPSHRTEKDALDLIKDYIKIVVIPRDKKADILNSLFIMGLNFENLYPDLDNAVKSIKFLNKINRGDN